MTTNETGSPDTAGAAINKDAGKSREKAGIVLAIDGPSAAGKSTVAAKVSKRLGIHRLDTGALFRALAWKALEEGAALNDSGAVMSAISGCRLDIDIEGESQRTLIDGEDVTERIRSEEVSKGAAALGGIPEVRRLLTDRVRAIASRQAIVVDGRDIGTAMLPNADLKIYLVAEAGERARRRHEESLAAGRSASYDDILKGIIERDKQDSGRSIAPLKKADDAIEIDSTHMSIDEVVDTIVGLAGGINHG